MAKLTKGDQVWCVQDKSPSAPSQGGGVPFTLEQYTVVEAGEKQFKVDRLCGSTKIFPQESLRFSRTPTEAFEKYIERKEADIRRLQDGLAKAKGCKRAALKGILEICPAGQREAYQTALDMMQEQHGHDVSKVWVLQYTHNHGKDLCVYASSELAYAVARDLVQEYRDNFSVPSDLSDDDAAGDWYQLTDGEENIEVLECDLKVGQNAANQIGDKQGQATVVVVLQGGRIRRAIADKPVGVEFLNYDVDGMIDDLITVPSIDPDGQCYIETEGATVDPEKVRAILSEISAAEADLEEDDSPQP